MPNQSKRIIVDGVDFAQLFLFPRILGAAAAALQPGRMIIALLMVAALITIGRIWDGATDPNVPPSGLRTADGRYFPWENGDERQMLLREALQRYAPDRLPAGDGEPEEFLRERDVLRDITRGYRRERVEMPEEQRPTSDDMFEQVVREIEERRALGAFEGTVLSVSSGLNQMLEGVFNLSPAAVWNGAKRIVFDTPSALWRYHTWFLVVYGLVFLIIMALGGGAIARMAAVQASGHERLSAREGVDFALNHWLKLVWALMLPLLLFAGLCGVIMLLGLLMGVPVLDVIGGIIYGLALLIGFLVAFILLGYLLGARMLIPAVAVENCDAADAMQRAYAYCLTRPLHLLGYLIVSVVGLALGFLVASVFAVLMLNLTALLFQTVTDNPALVVAGAYDVFDLGHREVSYLAGPWHVRWAASAITFWQTLVVCLVAAYVFSYHFSASTILYLLMRRASDGQDLEEIWRPGLMPGTMVPEPAPATVSPNVATAEADNEGID